jgi:predicted ATPase
MVGRDAELSRLRAALEAAGREGAASALLVAGEAGVGKTRLIDEFTERAGHDGALVLAGACLDVGETAASFAPFWVPRNSLRCSVAAHSNSLASCQR